MNKAQAVPLLAELRNKDQPEQLTNVMKQLIPANNKNLIQPEDLPMNHPARSELVLYRILNRSERDWQAFSRESLNMMEIFNQMRPETFLEHLAFIESWRSKIQQKLMLDTFLIDILQEIFSSNHILTRGNPEITHRLRDQYVRIFRMVKKKIPLDDRLTMLGSLYKDSYGFHPLIADLVLACFVSDRQLRSAAKSFVSGIAEGKDRIDPRILDLLTAREKEELFQKFLTKMYNAIVLLSRRPSNDYAKAELRQLKPILQWSFKIKPKETTYQRQRQRQRQERNRAAVRQIQENLAAQQQRIRRTIGAGSRPPFSEIRASIVKRIHDTEIRQRLLERVDELEILYLRHSRFG